MPPIANNIGLFSLATLFERIDIDDRSFFGTMRRIVAISVIVLSVCTTSNALIKFL